MVLSSSVGEFSVGEFSVGRNKIKGEVSMRETDCCLIP